MSILHQTFVEKDQPFCYENVGFCSGQGFIVHTDHLVDSERKHDF